MKNIIGKKRKEYQKILKKLPQFYNTSEQVYREYIDKTNPKMSEEVAWAETFCYALAPTLFLYVRWVLSSALRDKKQRLYFLARDGYQMYFIAKFICDKWDLPLECRYLYCSRYSLRSGEYCLLQEKSLDYICLGGMNVTFESMMKRGGLNQEESSYIKKIMGIQYDSKKKLSYDEIKGFFLELKKNSAFMDNMVENSKERYPFVIGYLKQEGLLDNIPYAIVDSGWTGSIQKSFNHLLKSVGHAENGQGYYFGMYEYAKGVNRKGYHTYYFTPKGGWRKKALFCNNLFECIFSSPEGMTKGYRLEKGRYVPVLEHRQNPNHKKIMKSMEILERYAKIYIGNYQFEIGKEMCFGEELLEKKVISCLLSSFMGHPSADEAKVYGNYVFCDDITGEENQWVAARFSKAQLRENRIFQRLLQYAVYKSHPMLLSAWTEGSIARLGKADLLDFLRIYIYKYLLYMRKSLKLLIEDCRRTRE